MSLTPEKIAELKAQHGELYLLSSDDETLPLEVVVKKPGRAQLDRYTHDLMGGKASRAARQLLSDCLVHPSADELDRICAEAPGVPTVLAAELVKVARLDLEITVKKL